MFLLYILFFFRGEYFFCFGDQATKTPHRLVAELLPRRKSSTVGSEAFASAMAKVTSFNRWAIIEHDLATSNFSLDSVAKEVVRLC